jgi:predicted SprT family Zn-dependent metalloprotease
MFKKLLLGGMKNKFLYQNNTKIMGLESLQSLSERLLKKHGLKKKGWTFKFNRATRTFGICDFNKRSISISKRITEINIKKNPEEIVDTILHEIAHAMTFELYGTKVKAHGDEWKGICNKIGASTETYYDPNNIIELKEQHVYKCPLCLKEYILDYKEKDPIACPICVTYYNEDYFFRKYSLTYVKKIYV